MSNILLTKELPVPDNETQEQYKIIIPGRLLPGVSEGEDPFETLSEEMFTSEQREYLTGTVLHSLIEPGTTVIAELHLEEGTMRLPILPMILGDLEPRTVYDEVTKELRGTMLRLPAVPTNLNRVFYHQNRGNPPKLDTLYLSYAGDLTRAIDNGVLRTRYAPGISSIAMCNDTVLKPNQVCLPKKLAAAMVKQLIQNFYHRAEDEEDESSKEGLYLKGNSLSRRLAEEGPGILSGLNNIVCQRNPTTVYGAVMLKSLIVGDFEGATIYIRSKEIDLAGGKVNG